MLGQYDTLLRELNKEDPQSYRNFLRLDNDLFEEMVEKVTPYIEKETTKMRTPLEPALKLAVTLRYLATGNHYKSMAYDFRVAPNTISKFIPEVCEAITEAYKDEVMPAVDTADKWMEIAEGFEERWNMPHCCGALDGKHIKVKCPPLSHSMYRNYKGFFSKILFALVDHDYKFIYVEVGTNGAASDGQVFSYSELKETLQDGSINLPPPEPLPGDDFGEPVEYFIVGDDAFPLTSYLMKPYSKRDLTIPERVFNYRLSRARRIVENAFGILATRFQVLLSELRHRSLENMDAVIMCCCILHNLLRIRKPAVIQSVADKEDSQHRPIDGEWRNRTEQLHNLDRRGTARNAPGDAKRVRTKLTKFFQTTAGSVPWQDVIRPYRF